MMHLRDCETREDKLKSLKEALVEDINSALGGAATSEDFQTAVVMLATMIEGRERT